MNNTQEIIHFLNNSIDGSFACSKTIHENVLCSPDPEYVKGCVLCEAEATVFMKTNNKNLFAIFAECGCEVTSYAPKPNNCTIIVPHSCINHNGYIIGEHPDNPDTTAIFANDEEVRQLYKKVIKEL